MWYNTHNMKTDTLKVLAGSTLVIILLGLLLFIQADKVDSSAFTGAVATQSSATTTVVGPGYQTIFSDTKSCTARTIALSDGTGTGIRFITGDSASFVLSSTTLTNVKGLNQAGSTTVTYDGGLNGCGRWIAIASASTTVTLVEYQ